MTVSILKKADICLCDILEGHQFVGRWWNVVCQNHPKQQKRCCMTLCARFGEEEAVWI